MRMSLFCLAVCLLGGCSEKPEKGILTKPEMQGMIWDMMQVDEFATGYLYNDTSLVLKDERLKLYQDIFRMHKISEKTFSDSYKYYAAHPDMMKEMFDSLSSRGERERRMLYMPKDSVAAKAETTISKADSLKKDSVSSAADPVKKDTTP